MDKKNVLELKRRFTKENATFSRLCGCYVDTNKQKVVTFTQKFLTLDEEDFYKYLDIAKKSLSGKVGNNLLDIEFPTVEESAGGRQQILMALRDSNLENKDLLESYYDHIIDTYEAAGNYLILLFLDSYDVPNKGTNNIEMDDSDEVYKYIICAICPVNMSKPALGFNSDNNSFSSRKRDWTVGMPETAFLFPSFNDRSTDIHSVLFYTKNTKEPHTEFILNGLGCDYKHTSDEKLDMFSSLVAEQMENENEDILLDVSLNLQNRIKENAENSDQAIIADRSFIEDTLKNSKVPDDKVKKISDEFEEIFKKDDVLADDLINEKLLAGCNIVLEKRFLEEENMKLREEVAQLKQKLADINN